MFSKAMQRPLSFVVVLFVLPVALLHAAGSVRLELVGDAHGAAMAFQEWGQRLGQAGIRNVRLRTATDADEVGIKTEGTADRPVYVVTGIVVSRDALQLPGGRFRQNEVARLAEWLDNLAGQGPTSGKPSKAAFGLSVDQFNALHDELAAPVVFSTRGRMCREVVERIAERLKRPLKLDGATARALDDTKVADELIGVSSGTALACALGLAGFGFRPCAAGDELSYVLVKIGGEASGGVSGKSGAEEERWPVGWPLGQPLRERVPALYEFLNVNVQNVSAATALETIAQRLKTPVLMDHAALARRGIDSTKVMVTLPQSRTTYSLALRKLLFQARLKFEVRRDESDMPLLWVTSVKPG